MLHGRAARSRSLFVFYALLGLMIALLASPVRTEAQSSSTGAVNGWFNASEATEMSVDITPVWGEQGYHFYSFSPFFDDKNTGVYAGIQTNGNLGDGIEVGNTFIFSIWDATDAFPEGNAVATTFSNEGSGYSLRRTYNWRTDRTYRITIKRESFNDSTQVGRWSATILNTYNGISRKIGEIEGPAGAKTLRTGAVFHERYGGPAVSCSGGTNNLEPAGAVFSNLISNTGGSFAGSATPNNVFANQGCIDSIFYDVESSSLRTGFGVTEASFGASDNRPSTTTQPEQSDSDAPQPEPSPSTQPTSQPPAESIDDPAPDQPDGVGDATSDPDPANPFQDEIDALEESQISRYSEVPEAEVEPVADIQPEAESSGGLSRVLRYVALTAVASVFSLVGYSYLLNTARR